MIINTKDTYSINKTDFYLDINSLFLLYFPIVGYKAISLFMVLVSESHNQLNIENHERLSALCNMSVDEILDERKKLEEVMLLKTYVQEETINKYVYKLLSPLSCSQFLKNEVYSKLLIKAIGQKQYEITSTKLMSSNNNLDSYKEISSKLNVEVENRYLKDIEFTKIKPSFDFNTIDNEDIDFDYEYLIRNTSALVFPISARNEENLKLIGQLASLYGLSEDTMAILIGRCSNFEKGSIDTEKLKALARKEKPQKTENKDPYLLSPVAFLQMKQHGNKVTGVDLRLLDDLSFKFNMKNEVINVLVEYVLDTNQNRLPRSLVEKIAGEWIREQVASKEKALNKTKETSFTNTKVKKLTLPKYFEEDLNVEDKELNISDETLDEIKDRLRRV